VSNEVNILMHSSYAIKCLQLLTSTVKQSEPALFLSVQCNAIACHWTVLQVAQLWQRDRATHDPAQ